MTIRCVRCAITCIRSKPDQRYCDRCASEVRQIIDLDARRQVRRFGSAKVLTGGVA